VLQYTGVNVGIFMDTLCSFVCYVLTLLLDNFSVNINELFTLFERVFVQNIVCKVASHEMVFVYVSVGAGKWWTLCVLRHIM